MTTSTALYEWSVNIGTYFAVFQSLTLHCMKSNDASLRQCNYNKLTLTFYNNRFTPTCHGRVILIGDAAHCLDPVLAQGAGIAIEDAHELSVVLNTLTDDNTTDSATTKATYEDSMRYVTRPSDAELPGALQWCATRRQMRALTLSKLSNMSQWFGHMTGVQATVRDALMITAPQWITSGVFDRAMRVSANRGAAARAGPVRKI
jgi:FAD binding domain